AVLSRLTTRDLGPAGRDAIYGQGLLQAPAKCADKSDPATPVEVSSAWSPTLQPVVQPTETGAASGLMSLTPSAEGRWRGGVQRLPFRPDQWRGPLSPAPNLLGCAAPTTDRCSLSRSCFALPLASVGRGVSPPRLVARARVSPAASTFTALSRRRQR